MMVFNCCLIFPFCLVPASGGDGRIFIPDSHAGLQPWEGDSCITPCQFGVLVSPIISVPIPNSLAVLDGAVGPCYVEAEARCV